MMGSTPIERVQDALAHVGADCPIEEIAGLCPDLTWKQVFLAVDYLSRTGQVRVTRDAGRTYRVQSSRPAGTESSSLSAGQQ